MSEFLPQVDPCEVGLDPERLARLDAHFDRYVESRRLAGWSVAVTRHGQLAHFGTGGDRDREAALPVEPDTVFRIYSMTKPITSVLAMMLWEEGLFELEDPIATWIPSFADARVYAGGSSQSLESVPAREPIRIWHLLTHTAGLTYGFQYRHPVDAAYRRAGYNWANPKGADLAQGCDDWAAIPLLFEPGTRYSYSVGLDVIGRLIEILTGQTLAEAMQARIFDPLGMDDTGFGLSEDKRDRLAGLYVPGPDRTAHRYDEAGPVSRTQPAMLSGGGGLVSTAADYLRFGDMLRRKGAYDGGRLLGPRTVDYMTQNHLPGGADLDGISGDGFSESDSKGVGFGLLGSVAIDPAAMKSPDSPGTFGWGGAASTKFYVDPVEDITVVFLTQLLPSTTWRIRQQLSQMVKQAIID